MADIKFLQNLNINLNELKNARLENVTTDITPSASNVGRVVLNTSTSGNTGSVERLKVVVNSSTQKELAFVGDLPTLATSSQLPVSVLGYGSVASAGVSDYVMRADAQLVIGSKAVNNASIADSAVDTLQIASLAISEAKIANGAVSETKIAPSSVTNAKLATMATKTVKGNNTTSSGNPTDISMADLLVSLQAVDTTGAKVGVFGNPASTVTTLTGGVFKWTLSSSDYNPTASRKKTFGTCTGWAISATLYELSSGEMSQVACSATISTSGVVSFEINTTASIVSAYTYVALITYA